MKYILAIVFHGKTKEDLFKCESYEDAKNTVDGFMEFWEIDHYEIRPQMKGDE